MSTHHTEPDGPEPSSPSPAPSTARAALHHVVRVLTAVEMVAAGLAAALIFVLILVEAGQRYLPIDGWTWTGELARYSLVWLTFTAAGVLVTRDGHIALQLVDEIPSELVVRAVHVLALLIVSATGVGFALACWDLIQTSGSLTTPSLGMPMKWVYVPPLVGFVSTAIRAAIGAVQVAVRGVPEPHHADESGLVVHEIDGGTAS